jgi:site-specific DNA-methyltransferase (adenine-specific)
MSEVKLLTGDSVEVLKGLADNSVDSIVCDPPYGLSFMNKKWDYDVPSKEIWIEALRVLKPGGHLLAFGGTRTYHRLVVNIEDAGFEIRDQIQWLYGSGFPKSTDVAKRMVKEGLEGSETYKGFGSALKPANEPICVARKPLEKGLTLAQNVLKYGTGAINIDESRIEGVVPNTIQGQSSRQGEVYGADQRDKKEFVGHTQGRWPANIILDEVAAKMLDEQSGTLKSGGQNYLSNSESMFGTNKKFSPSRFAGDSGGASRFFYVAKASKRERGEENNHPTVKPIKLMEYLIRLITPKNGTTLDPFMGSGSTGVAAKNLGFNFIGIELNPEYVEIAKKRVVG